jgi:hypothetical protein
MRVFITPSCSSAVTWDSRWCGRADRCARGLRQKLGAWRFEKGALQIVERDFPGARAALQHLVGQRAGSSGRLGRSRRRSGRHPLQAADQVDVRSGGFDGIAFQLAQNLLDPVEGRQDERDRVGGDRHAVPELAHQRFGGMRQRLETREPQKAAGALDGMNQTKNMPQNRFVVRILLEPDKLNVDDVEMLARFRQKLTQ